MINLNKTPHEWYPMPILFPNTDFGTALDLLKITTVARCFYCQKETDISKYVKDTYNPAKFRSRNYPYEIMKRPFLMCEHCKEILDLSLIQNKNKQFRFATGDRKRNIWL